MPAFKLHIDNNLDISHFVVRGPGFVVLKGDFDFSDRSTALQFVPVYFKRALAQITKLFLHCAHTQLFRSLAELKHSTLLFDRDFFK